MNPSDTLSFVQTIITLIGACFTILGVPFMLYTVYNRNRATDNNDASKNATNELLLNQRTDIFHRQNQEKFEAINKKFDEIMALNQNHLHTVESKVDGVISSQNATNIEIAKLETTIKLLIQIFPSATTNIIQK